MLFSRACEYGLRAALYLSAQPSPAPIQVKHVAKELGIPNAFLSKVVRDLAKARLLHTRVGPGGGVRLAKPAAKITLYDVVKAIDGVELFSECILGIPGCSDRERVCPLHEQWGQMREQIRQLMKEKTLADFGAELAKTDDFRESLRSMAQVGDAVNLPAEAGVAVTGETGR
ncbi:MAG: Rrf2 family transcriptional regulator [Candidatus Schekmanbacteria bacterium]|nr:Rrf2 family transcriptional regulator [Candidatus Schekmanbacteria bacterium]